MLRRLLTAAAALAYLSAGLSAADPALTPRINMPAPAKLTLERLYASPALSGASPRAVKFSPDGKRVTFLKPRAGDLSRYDLWQFDVASGASTLLVDSELVDPADTELAEAEKAMRERMRIAGLRGITDYDWGTAETLLVPAGGDINLVTLTSGGAVNRQLTQTEAFEYDARVSPGGKYVSFIRDGALYAIELTTGKERRISPLPEPDKAISYGVAEFVAQEEMDRYTGYWWSPDDRHVAFTKVDESGVDIIPRFDIAAGEVSVIEQRYPRAGRPNAVVDLFIYDMATARTREVVWRRADWGPPEDQYLARGNWLNTERPDLETKQQPDENPLAEPVYLGGLDLVVQSVNRDQTMLARTAVQAPGFGPIFPPRIIEKQPHWVNISDDLLAPRRGPAWLLTTNEMSGYRHIEANDSIAVTQGEWVVAGLHGTDPSGEKVYFSGFKDTPLEKHLYAVTLQPSDKELSAMGAERLPDSSCIDLTPESARATLHCAEPVRITEAGKSWSVTLSPDGRSFVGTSSSPTQPPQTGLYRIDGSLIAWVEENRLEAGHPYAPYLEEHTQPEFGTLTAEDGQTMHYSIQKPKDFDPAKKYPVLIEVYGGPHAQTVTRDWGPLTDVFYTGRGYIVFRLDNRGSWNRGKKFEDVIHRQMGQPEVRDQLVGVDWLKAQPFVDAKRIAIQGWSYGGYMTLRTILAAPEGTFAAAVAGAPVSDWSLYDTFYTERYMGTPENNAEGYAAGSVLAELDKLSTPLLLVHGMADDNVTFDNTTRLMAALQEIGKTFEVMTYPGQRHGIRGEALQVHLMRTRMAFLERHLRGEAE